MSAETLYSGAVAGSAVCIQEKTGNCSGCRTLAEILSNRSSITEDQEVGYVEVIKKRWCMDNPIQLPPRLRSKPW